jgi:hypothetical protein
MAYNLHGNLPVLVDQRTSQQWLLSGQKELDRELGTSRGPLIPLHVSGFEHQIFHCCIQVIAVTAPQTYTKE